MGDVSEEYLTILIDQLDGILDAFLIDVFRKRHADTLVDGIVDIAAVGVQHLCQVVDLQVGLQEQPFLVHQSAYLSRHDMLFFWCQRDNLQFRLFFLRHRTFFHNFSCIGVLRETYEAEQQDDGRVQQGRNGQEPDGFCEMMKVTTLSSVFE